MVGVELRAEAAVGEVAWLEGRGMLAGEPTGPEVVALGECVWGSWRGGSGTPLPGLGGWGVCEKEEWPEKPSPGRGWACSE